MTTFRSANKVEIYYFYILYNVILKNINLLQKLDGYESERSQITVAGLQGNFPSGVFLFVDQKNRQKTIFLENPTLIKNEANRTWLFLEEPHLFKAMTISRAWPIFTYEYMKPMSTCTQPAVFWTVREASGILSMTSRRILRRSFPFWEFAKQDKEEFACPQ